MRYKKWDDFKLHCGSISKVLANPRTATDVPKRDALRLSRLLSQEEKSPGDLEFIEECRIRKENFLNPPLSEGCKAHLIERYLRDKYNLAWLSSGQKFSFQLLKGVALEPLAIEILSRVDNIQYFRPEEAKSSDFLTGRPDIFCYDNKKLVDTKILWNAANFAKLHVQKLSLPTYCQLQGYMDVYGFEEAEACYLLLNTPPYFIEQKKKDILRRFVEGALTRDEFDAKICELGDFFDYEKKIPESKRIIRYSVKRDDDLLSRVHKKIPLCRDFLNEFERIFMKNNKILTLAEDYKKKSKAPEEDNIEFDADESHPGDQG
jgi:hypothetical protein